MTGELTWLLTSTTYGTWLPGDAHGFVGRVTDRRAGDRADARAEHDRVGSEYDRGVEGLRRSAAGLMTGDPVWLTTDQARAVRDQFAATARHRGWRLHAAAVLANHVHLVVTADAAVRTDALLRDFKSYAARALNERWPRPASGTWWTASGSRRKLPDARAVAAAVRYVLNRHAPLALYPDPEPTPEPTPERGA